MDVAVIRQAIADACKINNDVRVYGYMPGNPTTPCWIIKPLPFDYPMTFEDETIQLNFSILVLMPTANLEASQQRIDTWIGTGPGSVVASIEADPTLGGVVSSASVTRLDDYNTLESADGGTQWLSAHLTLDIFS